RDLLPQRDQILARRRVLLGEQVAHPGRSELELQAPQRLDQLVAGHRGPPGQGVIDAATDRSPSTLASSASIRASVARPEIRSSNAVRSSAPASLPRASSSSVVCVVRIFRRFATQSSGLEIFAGSINGAMTSLCSLALRTIRRSCEIAWDSFVSS